MNLLYSTKQVIPLNAQDLYQQLLFQKNIDSLAINRLVKIHLRQVSQGKQITDYFSYPEAKLLITDLSAAVADAIKFKKPDLPDWREIVITKESYFCQEDFPLSNSLLDSQSRNSDYWRSRPFINRLWDNDVDGIVSPVADAIFNQFVILAFNLPFLREVESELISNLSPARTNNSLNNAYHVNLLLRAQRKLRNLLVNNHFSALADQDQLLKIVATALGAYLRHFCLSYPEYQKLANFLTLRKLAAAIYLHNPHAIGFAKRIRSQA